MSAISIQPDAVFDRRRDLMSRQLSDGFVVYDPLTENVHVLNPSVRFVWERCDGTRTAADTVVEVCAATELTVDEAAADVYGILRELTANDLVRRR